MKKRSKAGGATIKGRRRKTLGPKRSNEPKAVLRSNTSPIAEETEVARLTRELSEAREQQTATGDVLKVISRPSFDLQAMLDTLVKLAARLCEADLVAIHRPRDGAMQFAANFGLSQEWEEIIKRDPIVPGRGTATGRVLLAGKTVQIADVEADPEYTFTEGQRAGGFRTVLAVPLEREGETIGVIVLCRTKVHPFTDKQIALVQNFAAQAVIAIENARLLNELRQRTTDLTEALEQQTATSEVLRVISSSSGDLQPVFASMLENAVRICGATFGNIYHCDGDALHLLATHNQTPPAFAEARRRSPNPADPKSSLGRMVATKAVVHVADVAASEDYAAGNTGAVAAVELGGVRTLLAVPMLMEDELIGSFSLYRQEVRPFTDKQVGLVTNFAAQAVIAIENARLLNELRQSLERQTATSEVLQVISTSPSDLEPVFATMLGKAVSICDAKFGALFLREGNELRLIATHDVPPAFVETQRYTPFRPAPEGMLDAVMKTGRTVHLADLAETRSYIERDPRMVDAVEVGGIRTVVGVPLLKDNELIGLIGIYRQEVRPFAEKQIALLTNFAAQAVIAIENARLLNELRERTTDLAEALEQQTATSEVLRIISGSRGTLEPVFQAMLENATRICGAAFGSMLLCDGEAHRRVALHNAPQKFSEFSNNTPVLRRGTAPSADRTIDTKKVVHIFDLAAEEPEAPIAKLGGARTLLSAPMLKENEAIGVIGIYRQEVRPFTDKQIALLTNFAAQAVIAIENARLLNELRERTEQVEAQSQEVVKLNQQLEQRVADQVGEIERMSRLRRFLPPQVADLIVASGSEKQLESHRREITALFCDLRGFTGFSESADPEDVMTLLREYHEAIGASIIKYSGTLERYAGDGVMVVFNDPVPVDNPALQAVLMALEMRDAIGGLTETWRRWGHEIGFGIGIAHGFATLGTIGFEGRFDYAAIGTVSNVASRLCDEAKPGQILISPRVLTKVENAVQVEPVGEFELKGIRRPLAAYNVVGVGSPVRPENEVSTNSN